MATIGIHNFSPLKRGDTFKAITFSFFTKDGANKLPLNLSGATARMQLRLNEKSEVAMFFRSPATIEIGTGIDLNQLTLKERTPAETSKLQAGNYLYDIEITFADGTVQTLIEGILPVSNDITRN